MACSDVSREASLSYFLRIPGHDRTCDTDHWLSGAVSSVSPASVGDLVIL